MSWVSERNLVSAISDAGGFGVIACSSMSPELLDKEIAATKALTNADFGVNLIVMHPEMEALIAVCAEHKAPVVVLAGGLPKKEHIAAVHAYGGKVMALPPTLMVAKRMIKMGVDALILEGSEAGGHIGPVSTSVLAQEILPHISADVPIFMAGGIGRGDMIASYMQMGAVGAQIGTLFAASEESIAHDSFKNVFVKANARDAVITRQLYDDFPVIPVRALQNEAMNEFVAHQHKTADAFREGQLDKIEAQLEIEHFWAGALRRAVQDGDVAKGSVMAGQSVGMVKSVRPVREIIAELVVDI